MPQLSTGEKCIHCNSDILAEHGNLKAFYKQLFSIGGYHLGSGKEYCADCWSDWLSSGPGSIVLRMQVESQCVNGARYLLLTFSKAISGDTVAEFGFSAESLTFGTVRRHLYRELGISQRRWDSDDHYCSFEEFLQQFLQREPTNNEEDRLEYQRWSCFPLCAQMQVILPNNRVVSDAGDIDDDCLLCDCLNFPTWVGDTVIYISADRQMSGKTLRYGTRGHVIEVRGGKIQVRFDVLASAILDPAEIQVVGLGMDDAATDHDDPAEIRVVGLGTDDAVTDHDDMPA
eukprot:TRINITY_DN61627_c0_g1_i1.p1 TRINITY_DN61627_c0_g1~~TRINITY_DN61627_c0_g1_i1.p1  ORF type:complete len:287 (+),score=49.30 TRINITY_DN61627_c0_g1_i1:56-916(+)